METIRPSETLVSTYKSIWRHNPEDHRQNSGSSNDSDARNALNTDFVTIYSHFWKHANEGIGLRVGIRSGNPSEYEEATTINLRRLIRWQFLVSVWELCGLIQHPTYDFEVANLSSQGRFLTLLTHIQGRHGSDPKLGCCGHLIVQVLWKSDGIVTLASNIILLYISCAK
jgi:hypothetical protein